MKHIYVGYPGERLSFETIKDAIDSIPDTNVEEVIVHIAPGVYRERLEIQKPYITLLGEKAEDTIVVYGNFAKDIMEDGSNRGTFRSYSVLIDTHNFTARNITFQNDAGFGCEIGQALALYVDGDCCAFYDCRLLSSQDTLFTGPLPTEELQPGGFTGPKEFAPRINGRQYYKNCYIHGDVDFIFGCATAYFEECEFFSQARPLVGRQLEAPEIGMPPVQGYVTAASTPEGQKYGYIIDRCKFTSNCPPHSVYLGRPWRQHAHTVLLNCELGAHIRPEGWHDWKKPHETIRYEEYKSFGLGANSDKRAPFSRQLTDNEALEYTKEKVLGDWSV